MVFWARAKSYDPIVVAGRPGRIYPAPTGLERALGIFHVVRLVSRFLESLSDFLVERAVAKRLARTERRTYSVEEVARELGLSAELGLE